MGTNVGLATRIGLPRPIPRQPLQMLCSRWMDGGNDGSGGFGSLATEERHGGGLGSVECRSLWRQYRPVVPSCFQAVDAGFSMVIQARLDREFRG